MPNLTYIHAIIGAKEDVPFAISYASLKARSATTSETDAFLLTEGTSGSLWYKNPSDVLVKINFSAANQAVVFSTEGIFINNVKVTGTDRRIYWLNNEKVQVVNNETVHDDFTEDAFRAQAMNSTTGAVSADIIKVTFKNIKPA